MPKHEAGPGSGRPFDLRSPRPGGIVAAGQDLSNLKDIAPNAAPNKRILIFADGTWDRPAKAWQGSAAPTNVWLLYQLVRPNARDAFGTPQLAYYHAGVGTGHEIIDRVLGGINGFGLRRNILACYRFLVAHYRPGDEVYLFGFSRGAYTVRSLAGLIRNIGVLVQEKLAASRDPEATIMAAWSLYRERGPDSVPTAKRAVDFRYEHSQPDFNIKCIGVWDTVGSLGLPVGGPVGWLSQNFFGFHDVTLSSHVDCAFQGLAIDEQRGPFTPTLWVQQPGAREAGQVLTQAWFVGVHTDVGGGEQWEERGLANVTLRWMIGQVTAHCGIDLDLRPMATAHRAEVALHNSMGWGYRFLNGVHITSPFDRCIDGGLGNHGTRDPGFVTTEGLHSSVEKIRTRYETQPMPVVGHPYNPTNVIDYLQRKARERDVARSRTGAGNRP